MVGMASLHGEQASWEVAPRDGPAQEIGLIDIQIASWTSTPEGLERRA